MTRLIDRKTYLTVIRLGELARKSPHVYANASEEKLKQVLAVLADADRRSTEQMVFEQPTDHEMLDQPLLGWRYFNAINRVRELIDNQLGVKALDDLLGSL